MTNASAVTLLGSEVYVLNNINDTDEDENEHENEQMVFVFAIQDLSFRRKFGGRGTGPGKFLNACSLGASSKEIFVCETGNARIQVVDRWGRHLSMWEREEDEYWCPDRVVVSEPTVCVRDEMYVQVFRTDGSFSFQIDVDCDFSEAGDFSEAVPSGLEISIVDEEIFVAYEKIIEVYSRDNGTFFRRYFGRGYPAMEFARQVSMCITAGCGIEGIVRPLRANFRGEWMKYLAACVCKGFFVLCLFPSTKVGNSLAVFRPPQRRSIAVALQTMDALQIMDRQFVKAMRGILKRLKTQK